MIRSLRAAVLASLMFGLVTVFAQSQKPTLYLVATAHLDTQWNWTVQDSIRQFIPNTFHTNFAFFEKYPDYVFSWEGAIHYMWFKEYHPEEWPKLQQYVASGRWRLAGSWINAVDANMPSPESIFRQTLYAQRFYRQEFSKVSRDIYLPDCFGFPFSLPSLAAHAGLNSFSTQKLTWGRPIPFPIGRWKGVDGSEILAELDPKSYTTRITTDMQSDPAWQNQFTPVGDTKSVEFRYFGTGDVGGGPTEESVQNYEKALKGGTIDIRNTSPDQLALDLTPAQKAALPEYHDELILKTHGTGCYTSQAAMKRFNRANELLADDAERAAVAASWVSGQPYPSERLREAWIRFLWHQFHDDLTGTCIPQAYQFSWNDELASLNQFAGVLTSATSAVAAQLDTQGTGVPLVVYNPLSMERREPVEATVRFAGPPPTSVRVTDADTGSDLPAQLLAASGGDARVVFLADVPPVGFKVFHVRGGGAGGPGGERLRPARGERVGAGGQGERPPQRDVERGWGPASSDKSWAGGLTVTSSTLENNRIAVKIDKNGDIASIVDKDAKRELLKAPVMLELRDNPSPAWPAWEVLYETVQAPAREYLANPTIRIVERGPVRVALEITRRAAGSTFVQHVRLSEGGDRVEVENLVDWKSPNSLLKASFPLAASNPKATYDLGLGTIDRTNNEPDKYEVPAQKWADVTDVSRTFGVGVINDSKHGWDKPTDDTLRLTLIHTPKPATSYTYQAANDLGRHHFLYAIAGHAGDWRQGRMPARAAQVNQPLVAFQATAHPGPLGRRFSMLSISDTTGQVGVVALKKAEDSDEIVVRLQERYGEPARATLRFAAPIVAAREVNGAEEAIGPIELPAGRGRGGRAGGGRAASAGQAPDVPVGAPTVSLDLKPYQPRAIAVRLRPAPVAAAKPISTPIALPFNLDGASGDTDRADGDFDGRRRTLAAEQLPRQVEVDNVLFTFGSTATGAKNVLVPKGERLPLPAGTFNRVYIVAAAIGGDLQTTIGGRSVTIREWQGPVGQWDSRLKDPTALHEPFVPAPRPNAANPNPPSTTPSQEEIRAGLVVNWDPATGSVKGIDQIRPAFVKRDEIAWIGTHRHAPEGNQVYVASYLFKYAIDLPPGARDLQLPSNDRIRILAVTAVNEPPRVAPAGVLYAAEINDPAARPPRPVASAPARKR